LARWRAAFRLEQKREEQVITVSKDESRADGLLLRYTEALKLTKHAQAKDYTNQLLRIPAQLTTRTGPN
jgi:hypothetical protein